MKKLLQGWLRGQRTTSAPAEPHPLPLLIPLALVAPLPFLISGLLRAVSTLSLPVSLGIALIPCALAVFLFLPRLRYRMPRWRSPSAWTPEIVTLTLVGTAIYGLYIRDFGGFPNLDGWDGGTHVAAKDVFATVLPNAYNSQVAYYAFAWWLEKLLGLNSLQSFAAAFYVGLAGTVAFSSALMLVVLRAEDSESRASVAVGVGVSVAATLGIFWLVWLPLFHYNQAAGYYAHLFGLWPLAMIWAVDALVRPPLVRVVLLLSSLVLLRYTYALNLADAFVATAFVLLLEGGRRHWRIVHVVLSAGLAAAAWYILSQLHPVFRLWGGMQRYSVDEILRANLVLIVGEVLYVVLASVGRSSLRTWAHSALARALRFPVLFASLGCLFLPILRRGPRIQYYYVTKYPVWACLLLAFGLVIVVAHAAMTVFQPASLRRFTVWLRVALIAVLLAVVPSIWQKVFVGYRETFQERLLAHGPPYRFLRPLADTETINRIKTTLANEHKVFGGYLTTFYPMFSFMNATLGQPLAPPEYVSSVTPPGHCIFWISRERDTYRLGPEGGPGGGQIVAQGTPEDVAKVAASQTGQFLRKVL